MDQGGMHQDSDQSLRDFEAIGRRTSRLQRVTVALSQALTVHDIGQVIVSQGRELFGATGSLLYVLDRAADALELCAFSGIDDARVAQYRTMPLTAATPAADVVRSGEPLFLGSSAEVRARYPALEAVELNGTRLSGISVVPMRGSRADVGVIAFSYYGAPPFDDVQRDLLSTVAAQCGLAIERAQAFESERRAHAAADAARAQLHELFMLSPAAVAIARGPELRFELVNERFQRLFGLPLKGRSFAEVAPELAAVGLADHLRRVHDTGERFASSELLLRPAGEDAPHVFDVVVQATVDAAGAIDGVATFAYDVTDRVAAQRRIESLAHNVANSEARLRALVDATAAIVWTARSDGAVVESSPTWLEFTGQTLDEYVNGGFLNAIHPDDREPTMAIWRAAVAAGKPYSAAYRLRRADGTYADTLVRGMPVRDEQDGVLQYVACNVDVSDLRKAESAAREHAATVTTLNELGQVIAADLDIQTVVQAVTDAATRVTNAQFGAFFYNVFDDHGGRYTLYTISGVARENFSKFPTPRNTQVFAPTFAGERVVRSDDITKDPRYGHNAPHKGMPEGHLPVRSYLAVPVVSRSGEVIGGIFLGHALPAVFSERAETLARGIAMQAAIAVDNARLYGNAQRLIKALEGTNRELDQFAYVTSHDLKAPLRGIGSLAEWIEEDAGAALSADARHKLSLLRGRVRRMEGLIQGILDFSRAGRAESKQEDIDLARLVVEIGELLGTKPPATVRSEGELPVVRTQRTALSQVLMNLIGNGLKHAARDDARVTVSVKPIEHGWEFRVKDNGPGIEPRFQERVWGIFQTLEARDTRENTGIGLAIVKKIVEARGGRVWIESKPSEGATFAFTWLRPDEVRT